MRKIIYHIATSIDGFIADKDGGVSGFLMEGKHADEFVASFVNYDAVIMGRGTYEFGFQFGLKTGQPAYQGLKHYIVSSSLKFESNDDVVLISSDMIEFFRELKEEEGKDIWLCGGGHLAGELLNSGLIDELVLKVNPFILGDGIHLFANCSHLVNCELYDAKSYANGVSLQKYRILVDE